jgi:hypothetical protein
MFKRLQCVVNDGQFDLADNDSEGTIRFADLAFRDIGAPAWATTIHELGHNWDNIGFVNENHSFDFVRFNSYSS